MNTILKRIYDHIPVPLQNMVVTLKGIEIHNERYGKRFKTALAFLRESQWLPGDKLYDLQCNLLQALITHAAEKVPYYRRLFQEYGIPAASVQTPDDLKRVPILTKDIIRSRFPELISGDAKRQQLKRAHTSGTTGAPLQFYWDKGVMYMTNAALWRQREWGGVKVGDPFVLLTGNVIVPLSQKKPPFWRQNVVQNQLLVSSFHLSEKNLGPVIRKIESFRPAFLEAYPSTAYVLARYLAKKKRTLPLKAVFTSSEPLYGNFRSAIEEAFDCRVFDYLGMAERVLFATQCGNHTGHHLNTEYGITEILDKEGAPAQPLAEGNIVATGLHNFAMPLIRYQTGDRSASLSGKCACGRQLPLIRDVTTKSEDIISTPDGRYISPSVLTHPFKPLHGISESQIIQEDLRHLRIKLVRDGADKEIPVNQLIREIKYRVGGEMQVDVEFVESIPRTPAGKLRWVISHIPLEV